MEKPKISKNITIEDIHKIREYHYEMTKNMTTKEWRDYFNKAREKNVEKQTSGIKYI